MPLCLEGIIFIIPLNLQVLLQIASCELALIPAPVLNTKINVEILKKFLVPSICHNESMIYIRKFTIVNIFSLTPYKLRNINNNMHIYKVLIECNMK